MRRELGVNESFNESYEMQVSRDERAKNLGDVALTSPHADPQAMYNYGPVPAQPSAAREQEAANARVIESIKTLDKDAFKLGDLNPLIHPTDLGRTESVDAVRHTIIEKISEHEGLLPNILESAVAIDPDSGKAAPRFVARFEVANLAEDQLVLLEELVKDTYSGMAVRTRTDSKGNDIPPQNYPPTQPGEEMKAKTGGWYMGPEPFPATALAQGLFVFKDYGPIDKKNFLDDSQTPRKYIIEIREASQYQTDLVTFVTQVSSILGKGETPSRGQLLYETYYDLIRLGLKKLDEGSIHGMDEAKDMIMRELIIPLASPELSGGINEDPQSVLMVGVPGTGKTLVAEWLLQKETGLFILPIDPFELQKEVAQPKEKQRLMPRIAEIARITGKRVILHVDDIENMVGQQAATNSTMLNLMAGVQESGFYIIASTNYPEQINPSLVQPQRFSVLIHCGLQDENARYEILKIHANKESKKLGMQLFDSEETRDDILREVAKHTENFTPRYLSNIATVAKSFLVHRVSKDKDKIVGLTEEDLEGYTFEVEDWEKAFLEVSSKYDSKATEQKDKRMAEFVKKHSKKPVGFNSNANGAGPQRIFSESVHNRVNATKAAKAALRNFES